MTRPSERELRRAVESVVDSAGETAAQDYVDGLLAGGWDIAFGDVDADDDETVLVLDCDDWRMSASRDELPSGIDVETLPVTSV
jgi:hypothetical protein